MLIKEVNIQITQAVAFCAGRGICLVNRVGVKGFKLRMKGREIEGKEYRLRDQGVDAERV